MPFQTVPVRVLFSKSTFFKNLPAENVPFSFEREAYPSHVSPFSKCVGIVSTQFLPHKKAYKLHCRAVTQEICS